ncbi:hypothetical protein ACO11T_001428 [Vibrio fluvialis]
MKILIFLLITIPSFAQACTCVGLDDEEQLSKHHNVYLAKLTAISKPIEGRVTGYLQPIETYKGKTGANSPIVAGGMACSHISDLKLGSVYLVFSEFGGPARVGSCSPTRVIDPSGIQGIKEAFRELTNKANKASQH